MPDVSGLQLDQAGVSVAGEDLLRPRCAAAADWRVEFTFIAQRGRKIGVTIGGVTTPC